jgi:two-component system NtrC family sensor kinase
VTAAPERVPENLRRMLDGSVDGAIVVDRARRVLYHNAAYDALTGRKPRRLTLAVESGACCHDLFLLEVCRDRCVMQRAVEVGKPIRVDEVHARRGDGEEVTLIVSAAAIDHDLVVETYRDVTSESRVQRKYHALLERERHAKEELERAVEERTLELKQAHEQLIIQEKMSSLGRLVAGIAHELNNPINFIYGNVGFLGDYFRQLIQLVDLYDGAQLPPSVVEAAERYQREIDYAYLREDWERLLRSIRAGAERSAAIVADLKTFSRPQVGKLEEVDLVAGLQTTLNLLASLLRDRITVEKDLAPTLVVRCRGGQVQQVLMNLLTNAAQACGKGGTIWIGARTDGGGVRISIRDSGPGVPAEVRDKIFDPFFTTKDVGEGTGLGLPISLQIVKSHGGRLDLVSPPGRGAEFVVWLPNEPPPDESANLSNVR